MTRSLSEETEVMAYASDSDQDVSLKFSSEGKFNQEHNQIVSQQHLEKR